MKRDAAIRILSSFRGMNQSNRAVHTAYGVEQLGVAESSVLQEALARPDGVTAVELSHLLALSPVKISRLVKSMLQMGLVSREVRSGRLVVIVTDRGKRVFSDAYARAQEFFNAAFERVPQRSRKDFSRNFTIFCDGLGAPQAGSLPKDPPLMVEIRRVTRAFGFLARDTFHSGRSPLEWHVLNLIHNRPNRLSCRGLATDLGTTHTTMTTVLHRLEKAGWLVRELGEKDARERLLRLTPAGEAELKRVDEMGIGLCARGIAAFGEDVASQFADNIEAYSGQHGERGAVFLGATLSLSRIEESALLEARSFVVRQRVKQKLLDAIPGSLLPEENPNFAIRKGDEILAVFEFALKPRTSGYTLVQGIAADSHQELKPQTIRSAYEEMRRLLASTIGGDGEVPDIAITDEQLSASIRHALRS